MLVHGTAIAIGGRAILLTGPSLAGKSDLALRALTGGAALIADDLVLLAREGGTLSAMRPAEAAPRLAVRGIGIVDPECVLDCAPLALCVALSRDHAFTFLTPQLGKAGPWHGLRFPQITIYPFEASAVAKLHLALERFGL